MVKCTDCGFLAFRTQPHVEWGMPFLAEADQEVRDSGWNFKNALYEVIPICFMRESQFMNQRPHPTDAGLVDLVKEMLTQDKELPGIHPVAARFYAEGAP